MVRFTMTPTINPTLVAVATTPGPTTGQAANARKANAASYASAMREANAPAAETATKAAERGGPAREAPFGVERPRYQRPGALLDIRV
ncbi:hypothetical protein sos41_05030 [Alphaproteobacteria bacterium SO-S41]|nr:hypothetical protein sos41_05030 [Alphaproteobacteria bacterium SO-S41]